MKATLHGKLMERKERTDKQGNVIPIALVYTDEEIVQVVNCTDFTTMVGEDLDIPVIIRNGKFGIYVKQAE